MSTVTPAGAVAGRRASLRNPLKLLLSAEPWLALVFMLLSFVLGLFWFVTLVTLISVGFGLIVVALVGVPILAVTLIFWTLGARLERRRVELLLGVPIRDPYRPLLPDRGWRRFLRYASDYHVWLDLLYLFLLFPLGIAEFVIATVFTALPFGLLGMPFYYRVSDSPQIGPGWYIDTLPKALGVALLGIPVLLLLPYVLVGVGRGHAWLARQLLGTNREREAGGARRATDRDPHAGCGRLRQRTAPHRARPARWRPATAGEALDGPGLGPREDGERSCCRAGADH